MPPRHKGPAAFLPAPALDALARGQTIEAIKLVREATGLGLKEAKALVDAHLAGAPSSLASSFEKALPAGGLTSTAIEALQRGSKIDAIRLVREQTGLGLKEAKDAVEAYESSHPRAGNLSPGQVNGGGSGMFWLALVAIAALGYYLLRRFG
jgi:ribosomal protein L7/L12